ncbi:MAG: prolipoprotein diacylglyceryl transferase [Desulfobulbaceae bacterium]|nr:prolipoprotein diacylglyceryl transferase [Desulfobulbaceae bacterium]
MIAFPQIDPVIFQVGPLQVRWYGLMYVLGFTASYWLVRHQIRKFELTEIEAQFENLNFVLIISLILGSRFGYVLFYNLGYYLEHPSEILATWQGGMSFHGGMLGLILGGFLFCRRKGIGFLQTADLYIVTIPIGLGLGRIGNFINSELYGRVSSVPWAMVFPTGGPLPRHPSQLYESFLEGLLLFIILWKLKDKKRPPGSMLASFLILYGLFRCVIEIFREPDPQLGLLFLSLTMGQILSGLMIMAGMVMLALVSRKNEGT